jgi:hypothetical protein
MVIAPAGRGDETINVNNSPGATVALDGAAPVQAQRGFEEAPITDCVCCDFVRLAFVFRRCMNIPAHCCTGCLGDIDTSPP